MSRLAELEAIIERHLGERASTIGTQSTAVTDGSRCYPCGRKLAADDIAWRARVSGPSLESRCERCTPKNRTYNFIDPRVSCGRQVAIQADNTTYHRKRLRCSRDCAKRAEVAARAGRRAKKRPKTCATCGREFIGTRADATTWGAACRRKAYRQRIAKRSAA